MIIIETEEDIKTFDFYWNNEPSFVVPIYSDHEKHPMGTYISFLYVRFRDSETDDGDVPIDYIINYNHNDCERPLIDLSKSTQPKRVWDLKGLLHFPLHLKNVIDLHSDVYFTIDQHVDLHSFTEVLTNPYIRNGLRDNLGRSIPIMKYVEVLHKFTNPLMGFIDRELSSFDLWMNSVMIPSLSRIEEKGINVEYEKFFERWSDHSKYLEKDKIYSEYNPYTITSRPSNRHGGINFGALNKKDGTREIFIPSKNHTFLQFDYDAYHVRLIGKLIDYKLPETSAHQWLADQYGMSYDESKGRTFQILYGGPTEEDKKIPFFNETDIYIRNLWEDVQVSGFVETPKGRKIQLKWIDKPTPQKVFNYLLQSMETEMNMDIVKKLYDNNIDSLVLYSYDAFLFDYSISEPKETGLKIKEIIESNGFPVHVSWGENYSKV